MRRGFGGQPSALERAQAQLQGKRVSNIPPSGSASSSSRRGQGRIDEDDEDDLGAYLSTLNRRVSKGTGKQATSVLSDDLSDLSISSDGLGEDGGSGHKPPPPLSASRFVKKSRSQTLEASGGGRQKGEAPAGGPGLKKSATSPNFLAGRSAAAAHQASAALQRAAKLGAKFASQRHLDVDPRPDSESDLDISLSDDSDDRPALRGGPKSRPAVNHREKPDPLRTSKKSLFAGGGGQGSDGDRPEGGAGGLLKQPAKASFYLSESEEGEDGGFGRDGNKFLKKQSGVPKKPADTGSVGTEAEVAGGSRFLKKKTTTAAAKKPQGQDLPAARAQEESRDSKTATSTPAKASDPRRSGASKLSWTAPGGAAFGLDSDEEDLEEFMKNLSPTSSPEIPPIRERKTAGPAKAAQIHNVSPGESPKKAAPRGRRPATPGVQRTLAARDLASASDSSEVAEESAASIGTESIEEEADFVRGVHTNVMQLEDLEPVGVHAATSMASRLQNPKTSAAKRLSPESPDELSEHSSVGEDIFAGLQTVDDLLLLPRRAPSKPDAQARAERAGRKSDSDSAEEIASEADRSISEALLSEAAALGRSGSRTPAEVYAEDTFTSGTSSPSRTGTSTRTVPDSSPSAASSDETAAGGRLASYDSTSRPSGTETGRSYTDDFDSRRTDSDAEDISRDDDDDDNGRHGTGSVTHSRSFTSYTESRTVTTTRRDSTPRKRKRHGRRVERSKDAAVQADGATSATHRWLQDLDLSALGTVTGIDPAPVAMHIINPQALEALTSYSPSILAMNDTLLSQLRHTRETVQTSLRLHSSFLESIETDFSYTTLEDTKEYIRRHRRPKLTMEQAMEEVQREMEEGYR